MALACACSDLFGHRHKTIIMEQIITDTLEEIQSSMGMDFDKQDQNNVEKILTAMANKIKESIKQPA